MQLKKSQSIKQKLALASSALLLATPSISAEKKEAKITDVDKIGISQLYYTEEERVTVNKTQVLINKEINESNLVKFNYVYDTMSGASPNGRIYSVISDDNSITYTTASGSANTVANNSSGEGIEAWKTSFEDTRKAYNAEWEHEFFRTFKGVVGGGYSTENDYESKTFSGKFLLDVNQRRTTVTAGMSVSLDTVSPFGGVPEGSSVLTCHEFAAFRPTWLECDNIKTIFAPGDKVVKDYLIGVTQVWNRRTLMQFNFAFSTEDGYLTDPYKQVSLVSSELDGGELAVLHEKRPDTRNTQSLFYKVIHVPTDKIGLRGSYRLYWDDWGVIAHTFNSHIRYDLLSKVYVQAHGRLHWQGAADFFQPYVGADSDSLYHSSSRPNIISADSRLGELANITAGIKLGIKINKDSNASIRIEKLQTRYDNKLLPQLETLITQFNLYFKF